MTSSWQHRGKQSQKTSIQHQRSYDLSRMVMFCKMFPEYARMLLVASMGEDMTSQSVSLPGAVLRKVYFFFTLHIGTVGPFAVKTGQIVYVNDSTLFLTSANDDAGGIRRVPEVNLRFFVDLVDPMFQPQSALFDTTIETVVKAHTSLFGADPVTPTAEGKRPRFGHGDGVRVVRDLQNINGCLPYDQSYEGEVIMVKRGDCTFLEKLVQAKAANASGVVVISDEDHPITPSADAEALGTVGNALDDVSMVVIGRLDGDVISTMLDAAELQGVGQVMMAIASSGFPVPKQEKEGTGGEQKKDGGKESDPHRVLYLNGHPLLNTRLLI